DGERDRRRHPRVRAQRDADQSGGVPRERGTLYAGALSRRIGRLHRELYAWRHRRAGGPMRRSLLKDNALLFEWAMRLFDPLLLALVGAVFFRLYVDDWDQLVERYALAIMGMMLVCAALFPFLGLYSPQRGVTPFEELRRLFNAWLLLATIGFTFLFLSKTGHDFSRAWSIYFIIGGFLVQFGARAAIRLSLRALRRRGYNVRRIAIVGAGDLGREIAKRILRMPWSGLEVRGFYDDDPALRGAAVEGVTIVGAADCLLRDLEGGAIDQVWMALP